MWTYDSTTGNVTNPDGTFLGTAYSGNGVGLNNPAMENIHNHGPIPRGQWTIGAFFDDPEKGPIVCHLSPAETTDTYGRSGFMIHGDNKALDNTASEGCIVAPRFVRDRISESADRVLQVV